MYEFLKQKNNTFSKMTDQDQGRSTKGMPWLTNSIENGVPLFNPPKYEWYEQPKTRLISKLLILMNLLSVLAFCIEMKWSKLSIILVVYIFNFLILRLWSWMQLHTYYHIQKFALLLWNLIYMSHENPAIL